LNDQTRNLNPTKPARVAVVIWGKEYAEKGLGSMDFYDQLSAADRERCELVVEQMETAFNIDLDDVANLKQELKELHLAIDLLTTASWLSPKKLKQAKDLASSISG